MSHLRREGLATSLGAGYGNYLDHSMLSVRVKLTKDGASAAGVRRTIGAVLAAAAQLAAAPQQALRRVHKDNAAVGALDWQWYEKPSHPAGQIADLAVQVHHVDEAELLKALFVRPHPESVFDAALVADALGRVHAGNMRVTMTSAAFMGADAAAFPDADPNFGTRYRTRAMTAEDYSGWAAAAAAVAPKLTVPAPNDFIPADFTLADTGGAVSETHAPAVRFEEGNVRVRVQQNDFAVPLVSAVVDIDLSTWMQRSARDRVSLNLAVSCFRDAIAEELYPAEVAGVKRIKTAPTGTGVRVTMLGYSDVSVKVLELVVRRLVAMPLEDGPYPALPYLVSRMCCY